MLTRIRNRLDAKIILSLSIVMAFMIGVYTHIDIQNMQLDTNRISEQILGTFASAIHMTISIGVATHFSGSPTGMTKQQTRLYVGGQAFRA
jgi:hypothetical protein